MQREILNYCPAPHRPASVLVTEILCITGSSLLLLISLIWCIATWSSPGRFVFLPGGDVDLGFRSHAGWVQWIEYAPWMANPDLAEWSLPWIAVFAVELLPIAYLAWRRRRGGAA